MGGMAATRSVAKRRRRGRASSALPPITDMPTTRARAIGMLATLVGAISMARAVNDEGLSDELLSAAAVVLTGEA